MFGFSRDAVFFDPIVDGEDMVMLLYLEVVRIVRPTWCLPQQ